MRSFRRLLIVMFCVAARAGAAEIPASGPTDFYHAGDPLLESLLREALDSNPGLRSSEALWRAAEQRVPQASALPDPTLSFTHFIEPVQTRVGPQEQVLSLSQRIPWYGKRRIRAEAAGLRAEALGARARALHRDVVLRLKNAYYEMAYLDAAISIVEEDRELLRRFEAVARSRYSTGQGLAQVVIKIQAEMTRAETRLMDLRQRRLAAQAMINRSRGADPVTPIPAISLGPLPLTHLDLADLYAVAEAHQPDLAAARDAIQADEQDLVLARREYRPDFMVGLSYVRVGDREDQPGLVMPPPDNGDDALNFTVGVNIPLWRGRLKAGVREAALRREAGELDLAETRNRVHETIRLQALRLESAADQARLYEEVLLPQAHESLRSAESAYETGEIRGLDLLDSERVLLDVRLGHVRLRMDYMQSLAEMERAIGSPFPPTGEPGEAP